ncbi:hypothetical protein SDC9_197745 [bioreactor metagenome]|uniref:Uncharacterized protein n=1 Tax=bioreactor metagenome TaxID=1076179 RepID=A0A645II17_9ZZZZ
MSGRPAENAFSAIKYEGVNGSPPGPASAPHNSGSVNASFSHAIEELPEEITLPPSATYCRTRSAIRSEKRIVSGKITSGYFSHAPFSEKISKVYLSSESICVAPRTEVLQTIPEGSRVETTAISAQFSALRVQQSYFRISR